MAVTLPLEKMSSAEKVELMESLWADLCRKPEEVESPSWHDDVLREREKRLETGEEQVLEWSEAKRRIRESVS
jgi:hypothetical protein